MRPLKNRCYNKAAVGSIVLHRLVQEMERQVRIHQNYPGLDREATEYLSDLGAVIIGADAPSIDSYHEVKVVMVQPAHIVCRERRILNIENLANVDLIPSHEFWYVGLPLKFRGATGSPFRGVAIVPVEE